MCGQHQPVTAAEAIASVVEHAFETVPCAAAFVPTRTGTTARMISRFNPAVWIVALSRDAGVCQGLAFSYGVHSVQLTEDPENWRDFARAWLREHQVPGTVAMLVAGPSTRNPDANHRIEFLRLGSNPTA
jgi:pyruvate kinase